MSVYAYVQSANNDGTVLIIKDNELKDTSDDFLEFMPKIRELMKAVIVKANRYYFTGNMKEHKDEIMNIINSTIDVSSGNEDDGFDKEYNLKHVVNYEPITAIDKIKNWGKV